MKKITLISLYLLFLFAHPSLAQVNTSISNLFRYGTGTQTLGEINENFTYRENLTDVKFRFPYEVTAGIRFLYDDPPEVGQRFKGIDRRFIEFTKDHLYLRVGNFSELYGKGLALNLFEERGLAYNTWMDGLKSKYVYNNLKFSMIYGSLTFADSINFWREEEYTLIGGNIEYEYDDFATVGFSYIDAAGKIPLTNLEYELKAEVPELYLTLDAGDFNWYVNYARKWTNVIDIETSTGYGIYSSFSYNTSGFGLLIDYKNYRFDERNPFERNDFTRPTRMLPFQNPPIVMKEHSYLFLSRSIHEIDFNDEVGVQLELFYSLFPNTYLNFNTSLSSRHNYYSYNKEAFRFNEIERERNFLPTTDDKYSPFWEFFLEAEQYFESGTSLNLGIARRSKVIYNEITGQSGSHKIKSTVVPFLIQHSFGKNFSTQVQYEFESVSDNYNTPQTEYNNQFISIVGNFYSLLSLNLRYELTSNKHDLSGRKDWYVIEAGYRISYSHNISVSYGRERGGQTCSNGVCRYVLPFEGFKVTFLSTF